MALTDVLSSVQPGSEAVPDVSSPEFPPLVPPDPQPILTPPVAPQPVQPLVPPQTAVSAPPAAPAIDPAFGPPVSQPPVIADPKVLNAANTCGPGGDCSSLAQSTLRNLGINAPRTAIAQYRAATPVTSTYEPSVMQPGDLVFFDNKQRDDYNTVGKMTRGGNYVNHVGVYLGNGQFIADHGEGEKSTRTVQDLGQYLSKTGYKFMGAGRFGGSASADGSAPLDPAFGDAPASDSPTGLDPAFGPAPAPATPSPKPTGWANSIANLVPGWKVPVNRDVVDGDIGPFQGVHMPGPGPVQKAIDWLVHGGTPNVSAGVHKVGAGVAPDLSDPLGKGYQIPSSTAMPGSFTGSSQADAVRAQTQAALAQHFHDLTQNTLAITPHDYARTNAGAYGIGEGSDPGISLNPGEHAVNLFNAVAHAWMPDSAYQVYDSSPETDRARKTIGGVTNLASFLIPGGAQLQGLLFGLGTAENLASHDEGEGFTLRQFGKTATDIGGSLYHSVNFWDSKNPDGTPIAPEDRALRGLNALFAVAGGLHLKNAITESALAHGLVERFGDQGVTLDVARQVIQNAKSDLNTFDADGNPVSWGQKAINFLSNKGLTNEVIGRADALEGLHAARNQFFEGEKPPVTDQPASLSPRAPLPLVSGNAGKPQTYTMSDGTVMTRPAMVVMPDGTTEHAEILDDNLPGNKMRVKFRSDGTVNVVPKGDVAEYVDNRTDHPSSVHFQENPPEDIDAQLEKLRAERRGNAAPAAPVAQPETDAPSHIVVSGGDLPSYRSGETDIRPFHELQMAGFTPIGNNLFAAPANEPWVHAAIAKYGLKIDPEVSKTFSDSLADHGSDQPVHYEPGKERAPIKNATSPNLAVIDTPVGSGTQFVSAEGHPVTESRISPHDIDVLPGLQYKKSGIVNASSGTSNQFEGVHKYDQSSGGAITVWKRNDGKRFVMNGHHRLDLAKRTNEPHVLTHTYNESDGIDFHQARGLGALQNIREDKGTAIDAAAVMRDLGYTPKELKESGISTRSNVAKDALSLLKLQPESIQMVADGDVPEAVGAAIGDAGLTPRQEAVAMNSAKKNPGMFETRREGMELAEEARSRQSVLKEADPNDLFGEASEEIPIAERAKLSATLVGRLASNKRLLTALMKGKAVGGTVVDVDAQQSAASIQEFAQKVLRTDPELSRIMDEEAVKYATNKTRGQLETSVDRLEPVAIAASERRLADLRPTRQSAPLGDGGPARTGEAVQTGDESTPQLDPAFGDRIHEPSADYNPGLFEQPEDLNLEADKTPAKQTPKGETSFQPSLSDEHIGDRKGQFGFGDLLKEPGASYNDLPEADKAYANKFGELFLKKTGDFDKWSALMTEEFGPNVKPILNNLFRSLGGKVPAPKEFKSGPMIHSGPGADVPVNVTHYLGTDTNGRHYVGIEGSKTGVPMDELRPAPAEPGPDGPPVGMSRGFENPERTSAGKETLKPEGKTPAQIADIGKKLVESGKANPSEIIRGQTTPNVDDAAAVLHYKRELANESNRLTQKLQTETDPATALEIGIQQDQLSKEMDLVHAYSQKVRALFHGLGIVLQTAYEPDFSEAGLRAQGKASNLGEELSTGQRKRLDDSAATIVALQSELARLKGELMKDAPSWGSQLTAKLKGQVIDRIAKLTGGRPDTKKVGGSKKSGAIDLGSLTTSAQKQLIRQVRALAAHYATEGAKNIDEVLARFAQEPKMDHLSDENILDILSGKFKSTREELTAEKLKVKQNLDGIRHAALFRQKPWINKVATVAYETANSLAMGTKFLLHPSAPFIQGRHMMFTDPVSWAKGWPAMIKGYKSGDDFLRAQKAEMMNHPMWPKAKAAGFEEALIPAHGGLTSGEEMIATDMARRIPVLGKVFEHGGAAFAGCLNAIKWNAFLTAARIDPNDPAYLHARVLQIATFTGRSITKASKAVGSSKLARLMFLAPRFRASKIEFGLGAPVWGSGSAKGAAHNAWQYAKYALGIAAVNYVLHRIWGGQSNNDPRDKRFGYTRIGENDIDIYGQDGEALKLIIRSLYQKIDAKGKASHAQNDWKDELSGYATNDMPPLVNLAKSALSAGTYTAEGRPTKDAFGRGSKKAPDFDWSQALKNAFEPLMYQSAVDEAEKGANLAPYTNPIGIMTKAAQHPQYDTLGRPWTSASENDPTLKELVRIGIDHSNGSNIKARPDETPKQIQARAKAQGDYIMQYLPSVLDGKTQYDADGEPIDSKGPTRPGSTFKDAPLMIKAKIARNTISRITQAYNSPYTTEQRQKQADELKRQEAQGIK